MPLYLTRFSVTQEGRRWPGAIEKDWGEMGFVALGPSYIQARRATHC